MSLSYRLLHPVVKRLRTSPTIIRLLWNVKLPPNCEVHWDTVTFLMRKPLKKFRQINAKVLEIGIGQGALNSLYLQRSSNSTIHGTDISEGRVEQSKRIADFNKSDVYFWKSDLFAEVREKYDLIFFNPPYVPTSKGRELGLTKKLNIDSDNVWDGGADGMQLIRRFLLEAKAHLTQNGKILMGVQDIYIPKKAMLEELDSHRYSVVTIHKSIVVNLILPTSIYEISLKL